MTSSEAGRLVPTGTLRAAINMRNPLLVSGTDDYGRPVGVAPDVAAEIARRLDVPVTYVPYASPGRLADAVVDGAWDIGLIGAEPKRAELIAFSPAYVEAGAFYLVRADSPIQNNDDVDRPGARVSVAASTAYDLWLTRNLAYAKICRAETPEASLRQFVHEGMDVLADLKERLLGLTLLGSGARMLPEPFTAVQQAVGIPRANIAGAALVRDIVEDIKASGFVAASIGQHSAMGLDVAPAAALEG